ncbi:MAG: zinc metalloprotease [Flavobacteriales bacterium]|nr:zinc metalloprotease [Flavobacteriales bacterium]
MKYFILITFLLSNLANSQIHRCSTDEYRQFLKEKGLLIDKEKHTIQYRHSLNTNYSIPVVVHVLYNNSNQNISDERILSQIDVLNEDFNALNSNISTVPAEFQSDIGNVGISFCLIQEDLNGNPFSGINRVFTNVEQFQGFSDAMKKTALGGADAWNSDYYLNIWVCDLSGNALGFATMPGDVTPDLDGVVIDYEFFGINNLSSSPYNLGKTATHEIGHYLNLEHIFYAGCSSWDDCNDTPPQASATYGCPSATPSSCQTNDMFMNYMDYTDDACMSMFTVCQANKMIDALLNLRPQLNGECVDSSFEEPPSIVSLIFPNPASTHLKTSINNQMISIYSIYGKKILSQYVDDKCEIDITQLSVGSYFIYIDNQYQKFIKY